MIMSRDMGIKLIHALNPLATQCGDGMKVIGLIPEPSQLNRTSITMFGCRLHTLYIQVSAML